MKFLILVLVFLLQRTLDISGGVHRGEHWLRFQQRMGTGLLAPVRDGRVLFLVLVAAPPALAGTTLWLTRDWLFGIPVFVMSLAVLLYSLGRDGVNEQVSNYLQDWKRGAMQSAFYDVQNLVPENAMGEHTEPAWLHEQVCKSLLFESLERYFTVIFWFLLLGPAGALLVWLSGLATRSEALKLAQTAQQVQRVLEWLPIRLLLFTCALAGDFSRCAGSFLGLGRVSDRPGRQVLFDAAAKALPVGAFGSLPMMDGEDPAGQEEVIREGLAQISALGDLLHRSAMIWLVLFAIAVLIFSPW